ncbi:Ankyrin [Raphidiopsis brookii D9]|nr:Ankyrin [Raphidiopsis brookii D9]
MAEDGNSALVKAIIGNHPETFQLLLTKGANVNLQDPVGITPLMYATKQGYIRAVDMLIKAGAKVNTRNHGGYTALMIAKSNNYAETSNLLIQAGAKE